MGECVACRHCGLASHNPKAVKIFMGVTHRPRFDYLTWIDPDEVNFGILPERGEFKVFQPGDLFLFKLKGTDATIAGGGVFSHASPAPLSLAWDAFGQKVRLTPTPAPILHPSSDSSSASRDWAHTRQRAAEDRRRRLARSHHCAREAAAA